MGRQCAGDQQEKEKTNSGFCRKNSNETNKMASMALHEGISLAFISSQVQLLYYPSLLFCLFLLSLFASQIHVHGEIYIPVHDLWQENTITNTINNNSLINSGPKTKVLKIRKPPAAADGFL